MTKKQKKFVRKILQKELTVCLYNNKFYHYEIKNYSYAGKIQKTINELE
jgi:hypothetical protein